MIDSQNFSAWLHTPPLVSLFADRNKLVEDRYGLCNEWLHAHGNPVFDEVIFCGVALGGHNGSLLVKVLEDILVANPTVSFTHIDVKPKRKQVQWLRKRLALFEESSMTQIALTAMAYLQRQFPQVRVNAGDFPTTQDLNRHFATFDSDLQKWVINRRPVIDDAWAMDLFNTILIDNEFHEKTGRKTRGRAAART